MNISFCKKFILYLAFFSCAPLIHADNSAPQTDIPSVEQQVAMPADQTDKQVAPEQPEQIDQEQLEALSLFFDHTAAQLTTYLEHLENIVQQMALIVSSHQLRNVDPQLARQHLDGIKHDLSLAKRQLEAQPANPQTVLLLISYAQVMTTYLHDVIKSGLKTFPEIKNYIPLMQKRSSSLTQKTPADIQQTFVNMQKAVLKLEKEAESVGISRFNKTVRLAQQKWSDWHMTRNIKWLVVGSVLLYALLPYSTDFDAPIRTDYQGGALPSSPLYSTDRKENRYITIINPINFSEKLRSLQAFFGKKPLQSVDTTKDYIHPENPITTVTILTALKNFLGGRPYPVDHYKNVPGSPKNRGTIKIFSFLESLMIQTGIGSLSLSNPIFDLAIFGTILKEDVVNMYGWAADKASSINSRLRGGPVVVPVSDLRVLQQPRHTLDAIIGREDAKQIASHIVEYVINPDRFDRSGTSPEQGYLLAGPTRSGKTFFAEALAGTIQEEMLARGKSGFNFISLNSSEVIKYGITEVLKFARENAPCVLFIDEIDMLGLQRERNAEILSTFLTQLSGAMNPSSDKKVILIGATNLPENLDRALLQHGRIGTTLWFYYPTYEERFEFMKRKLTKWATSVPHEYLAQIARETHGYNFADLEAILTKAKLFADQKKKAISVSEIDRAFDRVIRNIIEEPIPVALADKQLYALHNGAKALVSVLLGTNEQLSKVTIKRVETKVTEKPLWARYDEQTASAIEKRKETFGKVFTQVTSTQRIEKNRFDYLAEIKMLLAGHAAEKIVLGAKSIDYNPYDEAIALAMCRFLIFKGTLEDRMPKTKRQELEIKAHALMKSCKEDVKKLLAEHKDKLMAVTEQLVARETLDASEVRAIMGIAPVASQDDNDDDNFIDNDADEQPVETPATV